MCINDLNNIIDTKPKLKIDNNENVFIGLKTFSKNDKHFIIVEDKDGDVYSINIDNINISNELELDNDIYDLDR